MIDLIIITAILMVFLTVSVYNYYTAPVFAGMKPVEKYQPMVSVLIPVRNEGRIIGNLLASLAEQDYKKYEVIIGNDNSTDNTSEIVDAFAQQFQFVRKIDLPPLPEGWTGKNFAAHNITVEAKGDLFFFIDADVLITENLITSAVGYMQKSEADLLSVFPKQIINSWGERLIVPLMNLVLLSMLPLKMVYISARPSLSAGIGQFLMFTRKAYELSGGHSNIRNRIAEDIELIRSAKKKKMKVLTMLDGGLISCRMYSSFIDAFNGYSKNFFPASSLSPLIFILVFLIYTLVFLMPFIMVFFNILYIIPLIIIFCIRILVSLKSKQEIGDILLHPVQSIILFITGLRSVFAAGKINWKGRPV
jgi:glycosyltransferase involved in cell wall biosynthesis